MEDKEEQLVAAGNQAEALLGAEIFTGTINAMVDGAFKLLPTPKPSEDKGRAQLSPLRALSTSSAPTTAGAHQERDQAKYAEANSDSHKEDE